jgi:hypothetical protein
MSTTGDVEVLLRVLGDSASAQDAVRKYSDATKVSTQEATSAFTSHSRAIQSAVQKQIQELKEYQEALRSSLLAASSPASAQAYTQAIQSTESEIDKLKQSLGNLPAAAERGFMGMTEAQREAAAGIQSLGYATGVYLPSQMTRVLSRSEALQSLLPLAFDAGVVAIFAEGIVDLIKQFHVLTDWVVGYTKQEQDLYQQQLQYNQEIISRSRTNVEAERDRAIEAVNDIKQQIEGLQKQANQPLAPNASALQLSAAASDAAVKMAGLTQQLNAATDAENKYNLELSKGFLDKDTQRHAQMQIEVLRAQADALAGTGNKIGSLRLQLQALSEEEAQAVKDAAGDAQGIRLIHEQYAARRVELENQIAAAEKATAKTTEEQLQRQAKAWSDFETKMQGIYGRLEEMNREWEKDTARSTQRMLEHNQRIQDEINRAAIKPGAGGSQEWMSAQARDAMEGFNKMMREQQAILQMQPAALAAIARAYPGITIAQMQALPAIKQIEQAFRQTGDTILKDLDPALAANLQRLQQFENEAPAWAQKWDTAFAKMSASEQKLTLGLLDFGNALTQVDGKLDTHGRKLSAAAEHQLELAQKNEQAAAALVKAADQGDGGAAIAQWAMQTFLSYKQMAIIKGAYYAAEAVAAFPDFAAMAEYGLASALYFKAAGEAGKAQSGARGGGSYGGGLSPQGPGRQSAWHGGGSGAGGGASGQQLAPGGNMPAAPKNGNLTIAVMGETEAGSWLANTLNTAIMQGGAQLTATHTTAIPNPTA